MNATYLRGGSYGTLLGTLLGFEIISPLMHASYADRFGTAVLTTFVALTLYVLSEVWS